MAIMRSVIVAIKSPSAHHVLFFVVVGFVGSDVLEGAELPIVEILSRIRTEEAYTLTRI